MEKLTSMSQTSWILWKIYFQPDFRIEKMRSINTFIDLENILKNYDLTKVYFALFREGIPPDIFDQRNNYVIKHKLISETSLEIIKLLWTARIFRSRFINGIYCKTSEISIWADFDSEEIEKIEAQTQLDFYLDATGIFWEEISIFNDALKYPWIIGFADKEYFELSFNNQIKLTSEKDLAEKISTKYKLMKNIENCIILKSDVLNSNEWRTPNMDNRFIYCSVNVNLKLANRLLLKFMLTLIITVFPKIRVIYLAFCHFDGNKLQLGVYLTGKESILLPNIRRTKSGPEDLAFMLGHKIKQMVLSEIPPTSDVILVVTNAIPPEYHDFTNPKYKFEEVHRRKNTQFL